MAENGKYASTVYVNELGGLEYEYAYICTDDKVTLPLPHIILNGELDTEALVPEQSLVSFLSSYQYY